MTANPDCTANASCPTPYAGETVPYTGLSSGELRVYVQFVESTGTIRTFSLTPDSVDPTIGRAVIWTHTGGAVQFRRNGIYGGSGCISSTNGCPGGSNEWEEGAYLLSSSQTMTLEDVPRPVITVTPRRVVPGSRVDVSAYSPEAFTTTRWKWVSNDTLANASYGSGSYRCYGSNACSYNPTVSGRFYWDGRIGGSESISLASEIVWVGADSVPLKVTAVPARIYRGETVRFEAEAVALRFRRRHGDHVAAPNTTLCGR